LENLKGRYQLGYWGVEGRIILRWILKKEFARISSYSRISFSHATINTINSLIREHVLYMALIIT
jgi:hypothetical protein